MPVYMVTAHSYRSWREDRPAGYIQRGEGLKERSRGLAVYRERLAKQPPGLFNSHQQQLIHEVIGEVVEERELKCHVAVTCPTHVHVVVSFRSPACTCGASEHCLRGCPARCAAEDFVRRLKRKMGQQLAKRAGTKGRRYFSRGWDLTPVRNHSHLDYLIREYLPEHEKRQSGIFRVRE